MGHITNSGRYNLGYDAKESVDLQSIEFLYLKDIRLGFYGPCIYFESGTNHFVFDTSAYLSLDYKKELISKVNWFSFKYKNHAYFTTSRLERTVVIDTENKIQTEHPYLKYIGAKHLENIYIGSSKDSSICSYDVTQDKILWENNNMKPISAAFNSKYLINNNLNYSKKICLDFQTGEYLWTLEAGKYEPLNDLRMLGISSLIGGDSLVSASWESDAPVDSFSLGPRVWFSIDIATKKLNWRRKLPLQLCQTIYTDNCYHYLYRDVEKGKYYYSSVDLMTGKDVLTIDITEEVHRIKPPRSQPFYDDYWWRTMALSESYIYFGIGIRYVRMDRVSYEMEVLYEGKSVFDNAEFAFGRLFVTEMIGGTIMFSEQGSPETNIDRFFMDHENFCKEEF